MTPSSTWEQVIHRYFSGTQGACTLCGLITAHASSCQIPKIAAMLEYEMPGGPGSKDAPANEVDQLLWQIETDLPNDIREPIAHHITSESDTSAPREQLATWLAKRASQDFKHLHPSARDSYRREARDLVAYLLGEPRWMAATSFASKYALMADYGVISPEHAEQVTMQLWKRIGAQRAARARTIHIDRIGCCWLRKMECPDEGEESPRDEDIFFLVVGNTELEGKIVTRDEMEYSNLVSVVFVCADDEKVEIPLKSGMTVLVAASSSEEATDEPS